MTISRRRMVLANFSFTVAVIGCLLLTAAGIGLLSIGERRLAVAVLGLAGLSFVAVTILRTVIARRRPDGLDAGR